MLDNEIQINLSGVQSKQQMLKGVVSFYYTHQITPTCFGSRQCRKTQYFTCKISAFFPVRMAFIDTGLFQNRRFIHSQIVPPQNEGTVFLWVFSITNFN
jgi:hypothetical protein